MYRWANPEQTAIIREEDGASIPCDPANRDFRAIGEAEIAPYSYDLAVWRRNAVASVEAAVSAARTKYAAAPAHQALIYDIKLSEAQAYVAAGRPADTTPYVMLAQSAAGSGITVSAEADNVLARGTQWLQLAAMTERLRIAGNAAIAQADTVSEIEAARDAHVAQLNAL